MNGTAQPAYPARHVPRLARRLAARRAYYGWYITAACGALMFAGVGVGYYGLAVLLRPLQEENGWSNAVVSGATGLYFTISGLAGALAGRRIDRHGPRGVMLGGCAVLGLGIVAIGAADAVWQLYAIYILIALGNGAGVSVGVSAVMTRWFVHRRARAMSYSSTGVSLGGVVLAPLGTALVDRGGVSAASVGMGLLVLVVTLPVIALLLVFDPEDVDLPPDGPNADVRTAPAARLDDEVQRRRWTSGDVVRTPAFWLVLTAFVMVMAAQTGFAIHLISFLEDRLGSRSAAAFALSTTAFGSIVARLVVGTFADRLHKGRLTAVLFGVQGAAVLGILATESVPVTYGLVLVFGFTIGNIYLMQSLLVGELFGQVSFGTVFGMVSMGSQLASGAGPAVVGALETATGDYSVPFVVTAVLTWLAAIAVLSVRPPAIERNGEALGREAGSMWRTSR